MEGRTLLAVLATLLLAPAVLAAYSGFVVGSPRPDDVGGCDPASLTFTGSDTAQMFVLHRGGLDTGDILYSIDGGTRSLGGTYGADGVYDFPGTYFHQTPQGPVWAIAPLYAGGHPGVVHEGWIHLDNTDAFLEDMAPGLVPNVIQRLRLPEASAIEIPIPFGAYRGIELTFEHLTEFNTTTGGLPCDVGGRVEERNFENRIILGFNVYRLPLQQWPAPDTTTPTHYLCGPDLDCTTSADNGFVAFIPLGDGTDEMSVDPPYADPKPEDAFRVEDRGNPNPNIVFLDVRGLSPDPPEDPNATHYSYVYQPVIKGVPTSTWEGIPSHDLDGDTLPEFLDPSGSGLGLTANGPGPTRPVILISSEVVVASPGPPPFSLPPEFYIPLDLPPWSDPAGSPPFQRLP